LGRVAGRRVEGSRVRRAETRLVRHETAPEAWQAKQRIPARDDRKAVLKADLDVVRRLIRAELPVFAAPPESGPLPALGRLVGGGSTDFANVGPRARQAAVEAVTTNGTALRWSAMAEALDLPRDFFGLVTHRLLAGRGPAVGGRGNPRRGGATVSRHEGQRWWMAGLVPAVLGSRSRYLGTESSGRRELPSLARFGAVDRLVRQRSSAGPSR
jgi:hypothetical protein